MNVAALMFVAGLISESPQGCDWIELGDPPDRSIEELSYAASPEQVEVLLDRVIDRLESRACLARSSEVLEVLGRRLAELAQSGSEVAQLHARVELVGARVELRSSCPAFACGEPIRDCAALDALGEFLRGHPELEPSSVEAWFVAGQADSDALMCVLEQATAPQPALELQPPELEPPPAELDPQPGQLEPGQLVGPSPTETTDVDRPGWNPGSRRASIALNAMGVALGAAAMVAGGVFLAIDERCPGGVAPDACEFRYSTREEGILALSLGGVALVGSTAGLTFSVMRKPSDGAAGLTAGSTGWEITAGWSTRF